MKEESDTSEPQAYLNLRRPMRRSHKKSRKGCLECKRRHGESLSERVFMCLTYL
jgi:hypothetical protein